MMRRRPIHWCLTGLALLLASGAGWLAAADPEDELKSAVVLSFLRYSEWPDAGARGPIVVGVVGRSSLIPLLQKVLEERPVNSRPVRVKELSPPLDPNCCQLVYVATSKPGEIRQAIAGLRGGHVLTIGQNDRFLESGGMVNLLLVDGHMSFEVSLDAVNGVGVQISSRLLRLGTVKGKRS
jgi:hypothetical protein